MIEVQKNFCQEKIAPEVELTGCPLLNVYVCVYLYLWLHSGNESRSANTRKVVPRDTHTHISLDHPDKLEEPTEHVLSHILYMCALLEHFATTAVKQNLYNQSMCHYTKKQRLHNSTTTETKPVKLPAATVATTTTLVLSLLFFHLSYRNTPCSTADLPCFE